MKILFYVFQRREQNLKKDFKSNSRTDQIFLNRLIEKKTPYDPQPDQLEDHNKIS